MILQKKIIKCPICRGKQLVAVTAKKYYLDSVNTELNQHYFACKNCGFVFVADPPTPGFLKKYYETSLQERSGMVEESEKKHIQEQMDFLKNMLFSILIL